MARVFLQTCCRDHYGMCHLWRNAPESLALNESEEANIGGIESAQGLYYESCHGMHSG